MAASDHVPPEKMRQVSFALKLPELFLEFFLSLTDGGFAVLAFHFRRFDDDGLVGIDEAELGFVGGLEILQRGFERAVLQGDGQGGVGAVIAQVQDFAEADVVCRRCLGPAILPSPRSECA